MIFENFGLDNFKNLPNSEKTMNEVKMNGVKIHFQMENLFQWQHTYWNLRKLYTSYRKKILLNLIEISILWTISTYLNEISKIRYLCFKFILPENILEIFLSWLIKWLYKVIEFIYLNYSRYELLFTRLC